MRERNRERQGERDNKETSWNNHWFKSIPCDKQMLNVYFSTWYPCWKKEEPLIPCVKAVRDISDPDEKKYIAIGNKYNEEASRSNYNI